LLLVAPRPPRRPPRERDGCAVETRHIAPVVAAFVEVWQRDRPATAGRFAVEVSTITAYEWLDAETGVGQDLIEKLVRWRPDRPTTSPVIELRLVDRLVMAIGRPDLFLDGTLPVILNPRATARARAICARELESCCGGSTA
jgi:hypothetical protein